MEMGKMLHSYKNNQAKISGFLEDYAFAIEAFTAIFEVTGSAEWLNNARQLTETAFKTIFTMSKKPFSISRHSNKLI